MARSQAHDPNIAHTLPVTGPRAVLALLGGALAIGLVWWSPSFESDPPDTRSARPTIERSPTAGSVVEPSTLAAAVIRHLDPARVGHVAGTADELSTQASITLDDAYGTWYFVDVVAHSVVRAHCQGRGLVCRTLDDGTLITLRAGHLRHRPNLTGWAYRPDGSAVLVEVFADSGTPSVPTAVAILADDQVGWRPSPETVAAGDRLDVADLEEMEVLTTGRGPEARGGGDLLTKKR